MTFLVFLIVAVLWLSPEIMLWLADRTSAKKENRAKEQLTKRED